MAGRGKVTVHRCLATLSSALGDAVRHHRLPYNPARPTVIPRPAAAERTRRIPFFRSHPSLPLTLAALGVVGTLIPTTPVATTLGFHPLPGAFFAALVGMVIGYLALVEVGKRIFYGAAPAVPGAPRYSSRRHLRRLLHHRQTPAQPVLRRTMTHGPRPRKRPFPASLRGTAFRPA
ncbi:hypothetical protein ACH4E7_44780 [Kitasatospora sp. NPDC018058]|uniref:hypothetical protein n=1 Tax=Kitasatospora sp. NPDC018058 TaxID=3364025 RepID=UPI0037C08600